MRHRATALSLALGACLAGQAARAGDEPDSGAKVAALQAKTAKIAAAFPEPSDKAAYTFVAEVYKGGTRLGDAKFTAAPGVVDGKPAWKATEDAITQVESLKVTLHVAMTLGKDGGLSAVDSLDSQDGMEPRHLTAQRTEAGLHITTKTGAADPETADVETHSLTFCHLASVLLFLRQAPAEPATYAFEVFDPQGGRLTPGTLEVKGPGTWAKGEKPVATWWALAHLSEADIEIYLSPEREILAISIPATGGVLAKPGLMKSTTSSVAKPAASAKEAAVRFTIGSNIADVDMVAGSIHVPTLYAEAKKNGAQMSESDFRADLIGNIKASMKHMARDVVERVVKAAAETATEAKEGDAVRFVFGGDLKSLEFVVKQFDDGWYIIKLPGS